ncbi:MAG: DUF4124 domain-containing protein [Nevskiales bacterium]
MRHVLSGLALILLLASTAASAAMYKWVDKDGVTRYGDRIPPEYAKQDREVLNTQGDTVKVLEHEKTAEELAEDARKAEIQRQEKEQVKRDRMLQETYGSEADLKKARDDQLASLDGNIRISEISLQSAEKDHKSRKEREAQLTKDGKPVPPDLQRQIRGLQANIDSGRKSLALRQQERQAIAARFDRDIIRWRQLKGITAPATAGSAANQGANPNVGK